MNAMVKSVPARLGPSASLEELIADLELHGKPHMGIFGDDGFWSCSISMYTAQVGADFVIRCETRKHRTAIAAVRDCHDRVLACLKNLGAPS